MPNGECMVIEDNLEVLRLGDSSHEWTSVEDGRQCLVCDRSFTGWEIRISIDREGCVHLHCPTAGCPGTADDWVLPDAGEQWIDWNPVGHFNRLTTKTSH